MIPIEIEVYNHAAPTVKVDVLNGRLNPSYLEELRAPGGGEVHLSLNDPKIVANPTLIQARNILKVRVDGVIIGGIVIGDKTAKTISTATSREVIEVSGESYRTWFNDAVVHPEGGLQKNSYVDRYFNFSTTRGPWYKPAQWTNPVNVVKWGDIVGSPWRYAPQNWPDAPNAYWIWSSNSLTTAAIGDNYFRYEFTTTTDGKYSFFVAADNSYSIYVDGQLRTVSNTETEAWVDVERLDVDLVAGNHVFAVRVNNDKVGPAGLLAAIFKVGDAKAVPPVPATLISYTGKADTGWKVSGYPNPIPAWTPGEILNTLLDEAQARGVRFPTWLTRTFSNTTDSYGNPWERELDWEFSVGSSLTSVIEKMEELVCDIWIDPQTLELHAVKERGVDRSVYGYGVDGITVTRPILTFEKGKNLTQASIDSTGEVKNALTVQSSDGWLELSDSETNSITTYGKIEAHLDTGVSETVSKSVASIVFNQKSLPEEGASYDIIPTAGHVPWVDFQVGDWVLAPNDVGLMVKRRVMSISVNEDAKTGYPQYSVEFDTIFRDNEDKLNRWVSKMGGGSIGGQFSNAGTGSTLPIGIPSVPPPGQPLTKLPVEVQNVEVTSVGAWEITGVTAYSQVIIEWDPVTGNTDGSATVPYGYEVWGYKTEDTESANGHITTVFTNQATLPSVEVGSAWTISVRALNTETARGAFSNPVSFVTAAPNTPMVAPEPPTLKALQGLVIVSWSGELVGNIVPPPQFRHVFVEYSTSASGTYTPIAYTTGREAKDIIVSGLTKGVTYWFRLVAVDGMRIQSLPSTSVSAMVVGADLGDLAQDVADAIDAAQQAAADADEKADVAKAAAESADTKANAAMVSEEYQYAQSASPTTPPSTGWSSTQPPWTSGLYIWRVTTVGYGDGTTNTTDPEVITGNPGPGGTPGTPGTDGRSVTDVDVMYYLSTSSSALAGGSWVTTAPTWVDGRYMWTKTVTTYSTGTPTETDPVNITGAKGATGTAGTPGSAGRGIASTVVEYATHATGVLPAPTSGWSTTVPTVPAGQYLWTRTTFTYTSGTPTTSVEYSVSRMGVDGTPGSTGPAGKGITTTVVAYQSHTSGTATPTGSWLATVPTVTAGNFLWTRTLITYTDASTSTSYAVARMGADGTPGSAGTPGSPGRGITSITEEYYLSTSATTQAGGSWGTTVPTWVDGRFYWTRSKTLFTDSTEETTIPVNVTGAKGSTGTAGTPGAAGRGVVSTTVTYQASASGTVTPTGSWLTTVPTVSAGQYLWTKTELAYTDATTTAAYSVGRMGENGSAGTPGSAGRGIVSTTITYQASANGTTAPTGTWAGTIPTVPAGQYLWTRTIIAYTDSTNSTSYSVAKMGVDGSTGAAGKGITTTVVTYQVGTSGTTAPTGTWLTTVPTVPAGQFLWTKTYTTYTDATNSTSYSVGRMGTDGTNGSNGAPGAAGRGISSTATTYQASASGTVTPTGSWLTTIPTVSAGQYLWTRTITTYTDASTTTAYSVGRMGETGATGVSVTSNTKYYRLGTSIPAVPTTMTPVAPWNVNEPVYTPGSADNLYTVTRTVYSNGDFGYSIVTLDTAFSAAKAAHNAAATAQTTADGKNKVVRSPNVAASPASYQAGDQWWRYSGTQIIAMWLHDGTNWVSQTLTDSVITNLSAGTITAGTLSAARIAANSISVSKLTVGNFENILDDPSFETNTTEFWTNASANVTKATTNPRTGARALRVRAQTAAYEASKHVNAIRVEPGEVWMFGAWVRREGAASVPMALELSIMSGATEATVTTANLVVYSPEVLGTAYVFISGSWTVPAGHKFAQPRIVVRSDIGNTNFYNIDDLIFYKKVTGSLIVDGTITATQIAAETITAENMRSDSIAAQHIQAGAVTAGALAVGAVTAGTIEAGAVTAESIGAESITAIHLTPGLGNTLVIDGNLSIRGLQDSIDVEHARIDGTNAELLEQRKYFDFDVAEGAIISSPDSPFSVVISNDKLEIKQNGEAVSTWNSGEMTVKKFIGEIVVLGNHQIEKRGTGTVVKALG